MDQIWAPWRMELIRKPPQQGCFFCQYIQEQKDPQNLVLERSETCVVVMNRFPYTNGHLMVVPYQHTGDLAALSPNVRAGLMDYTSRWSAILAKAMKAQGFNIGINLGKVSGAGVDEHLHIHIVPRWLGDTNFMPVLSDVKVINQSLEELYAHLRGIMQEFPRQISA